MLSPIRKPVNSNDFGRAIWELCDRAQQLQILQSNSVNINQTQFGAQLSVATSAIAKGSKIELYLVSNVYRDYLEAKKCTINDDGTSTASGDDEIIAKPFELQGFLFDGKTIDGVEYVMLFNDKTTPSPNYKRYWSGQYRSFHRASESAYVDSYDRDVSGYTYDYTFNQVVYPLYIPTKTVIAVMDTGDNSINLPIETLEGEDSLPALVSSKIDINIAGRNWLDRYRVIGVCIDGQTGQSKVLIRSSLECPIIEE
jgi:hypothetical protein